MPYKNLTKRRKYYRELMRKRRNQKKVINVNLSVNPVIPNCVNCSKLKNLLAETQKKITVLEQAETNRLNQQRTKWREEKRKQYWSKKQQTLKTQQGTEQRKKDNAREIFLSMSKK